MIQIPDIVCRCFETVGLMDDDFCLVVETFHDAVIDRRIKVLVGPDLVLSGRGY